MVAASTKSKTSALQLRAGAKNRFKGVRIRSWGKWVSEIRLPNTRARLWLGSYATAEQAARAFDVAVVCLRGRSAALNFPDSPPAYAPLGLPHHQIQELAASAAADAAAAAILIPCFSASASPSSSLASIPFDSRVDSVDSPNSAASDESGALSWDQCSSKAAETEGQCSSLSPGSYESEATATNSRSCSLPVCTAHDADKLEELLLLDDEQSSPLSTSPFAALQDQEQALNSMVSEWEELLWGVSISSYTPWDHHLLPLPVDDDLPPIMEPYLWSL